MAEFGPLAAGYSFNPSRLRALRLAVPLTIDELAERAHLHYTSVANYEKGETTPRIPVIRRLAEVLGCEAGDLMTIDGAEEVDARSSTL